jgi:hypothetical protein
MAKVTFNLKDENLAENLGYFVADQPIPTVMEGEQVTPAQWWKEWVIKNTKQAIRRGKKKLTQVQIDEDVIT